MSNDTNLDAELRALLADGRFIEAVKRYREATGAGLAAAKDAVEALERGEALPETEPASSAADTAIVALIEGGKKIEAIKLYRQTTGVGLKEAKDAVEAIAAARGITSKAGCLGVVLLLVSLCLAATLFAGELTVHGDCPDFRGRHALGPAEGPIGHENGTVPLACERLPGEPAAPKVRLPQAMKLWKEIDISPYKGSFPCLGDLDGDGRVDVLLYRQGPQTTPGCMVALNHDGKKLWEIGDPAIKSHMPDGAWKEPALRGIAFIYDIDQDGRAEVITEFWRDGKPMLYVLDGATGRIKHSRESPFNLAVRGGKRSRCHPVGRVAYLRGRDKPPAIVLIYGASDFAPGQVVALDARLQTLWQRSVGPSSVAHVPTVGDLDGDGRDEIVAGRAVVDAGGKLLWEQAARHHADCTAIFDLGVGKAVVMSICNSGPAFCLSPQGSVIWEKTTKEVSHGQGIWVGNFIDEEPGLEAIICKSGHRGDFLTVRATDGRNLASFQHRREKEGYPDFPCVVNWLGRGVQSLWIPIDRCLVDGRGSVVADLGSHEARVRQRLQWGTTKTQVAVQAFAVDLCGDERDELVLYQPYNGESIFIFTQPDSDGRGKPYVHRPSAYQIQTYF
jgi:large subunit ribosomal protein L7/L12